MKLESSICKLAAAIGVCMIAGVAHAQQDMTPAENTPATTLQEELQGVEPVVPVGPPVVPVKQAGPAVVPVAPVEGFEGVETVTLHTDRGPVVVISYPGTVPASEYNIDFSALDADGDGFISRTEVNSMSSRSEAAHNLNLEFQVADKNADGKLAFTEIIEWVY